MLTLAELRANMDATGRDLTPRAARDWWTKGILSTPRRRWLGRGRGSETFWTNPSEMQRAQIAYDLLVAHPRADTAILGVWLHGFRVNLGSIRAIYRQSIRLHFRALRGRNRRPRDDAVGRLAGMLARHSAKTSAAPKAAQDAMADLAVEFLGVFYGLREEVASSGLASLWESAAPYLGGGSLGQNGEIEFHPQDDDLATWAQYLGQMASLTAQRDAIESATDYELIRARRLVLFAFGVLGRVARANAGREQFEEFGRRAVVVFGRPTVPILIAVLRNEALRQQIVSCALDFAKTLRQLQRRLRLPVNRSRTLSDIVVEHFQQARNGSEHAPTRASTAADERETAGGVNATKDRSRDRRSPRYMRAYMREQRKNTKPR
jgi:hypothetical protein